MTELQSYIAHYFTVSANVMEKLESLFLEKEIQRNDYFTEIGVHCPGLAFIQEGIVRVYRVDRSGKEITQWISTSGSFMTDLQSLVFDTPSRWNIQALTDCKFYMLSREKYRVISKLIPNWDGIEKRFLAKCFLTLEDRVYSFLSLTAEERYRQLYEMDKTLFNTVPLHYLASMIGMTPETLSRIRRKEIS